MQEWITFLEVFSHECVWDKFLEVELLNQKCRSFVILLEIAESPFLDVLPIYTPISSESLFLTPSST